MIFLPCPSTLPTRVNSPSKLLGVNNFSMKVVNSLCNTSNAILYIKAELEPLWKYMNRSYTLQYRCTWIYKTDCIPDQTHCLFCLHKYTVTAKSWSHPMALFLEEDWYVPENNCIYNVYVWGYFKEMGKQQHVCRKTALFFSNKNNLIPWQQNQSRYRACHRPLSGQTR